MNLVQLSEQLKDVPDNFLMMEVQNPSGSYPSYLIVSEMTRRKRMRENAPKQEPQTTVAEDLMGGGIRAMQPQMPQQMPQQMPGAAQAMASQMPQMPQQMPQEPQMMAGGGLVAFEQGGPVRAQAGIYTSDYVPSRFMRLFMDEEDEVGSVFDPGAQPVSRANLMAPSVIQRALTPKSDTDRMLEMVQAQEAERLREATAPYAGAADVGFVPQPAQPKGTAGGTAGGAGQATRTSPGLEAMRMAQDIFSAKPPEFDRAKDMAALRQALPDTASQAMADYIQRQEGQMAGQRESNLNMALMQAGLGMMGSKARSGIQGIAEGGLEGLRAYRQGVSELQKGEQQIELARMKMAEAKDARERGLYDLSIKNEAIANDMFKQGQEAKFRGASVMATIDANRQRAAGRTADTTPSVNEVENLRKQVGQKIMAEFMKAGQSFDPNSPEFINAVEQRMAEEFATNYGKIYRPMMMSGAQQNRGSFASIMGQ